MPMISSNIQQRHNSLTAANMPHASVSAHCPYMTFVPLPSAPIPDPIQQKYSFLAAVAMPQISVRFRYFTCHSITQVISTALEGVHHENVFKASERCQHQHMVTVCRLQDVLSAPVIGLTQDQHSSTAAADMPQTSLFAFCRMCSHMMCPSFLSARAWKWAPARRCQS